MADTHIHQLRDIVIEWYLRDPATNGNPESYSCGFADGLKYTIKRLGEMGFTVPDAEVFFD
jgi:hypothetical protein